jgi:uncharacterized protein with HEPN domain
MDAIESIMDYTKNMTCEEFTENSLVQDAILRNFQIIGEASKHIPEDFKTAYPNIAWRHMAGFRDIIIHDYDNLDEISVWRTISEDLPPLCTQLKTIPIDKKDFQ